MMTDDEAPSPWTKDDTWKWAEEQQRLYGERSALDDSAVTETMAGAALYTHTIGKNKWVRSAEVGKAEPLEHNPEILQTKGFSLLCKMTQKSKGPLHSEERLKEYCEKNRAIVGNAIAWSKRQLKTQPARPNIPYHASVIFTTGGTEFKAHDNRVHVIDETGALAHMTSSSEATDEEMAFSWTHTRGQPKQPIVTFKLTEAKSEEKKPPTIDDVDKAGDVGYEMQVDATKAFTEEN